MDYIEALKNNGWDKLPRAATSLIDIGTPNVSFKEVTDIYYHKDLMAFIIDVKSPVFGDPRFEVNKIRHTNLLPIDINSPVLGLITGNIKDGFNNKLNMINENLELMLSKTQPTAPENVDISKVLIRLYVAMHDTTNNKSPSHDISTVELGYTSGIALINKDAAEVINEKINVFSNSANIQHDIKVSTLSDIVQHRIHIASDDTHTESELSLVKDEIHADIIITCKKYVHATPNVIFKANEHIKGLNIKDDLLNIKTVHKGDKVYSNNTMCMLNVKTELHPLFVFNPIISDYDIGKVIVNIEDITNPLNAITSLFHPDYGDKILEELFKSRIIKDGDALPFEEFLKKFDTLLKIAYDITKAK